MEEDDNNNMIPVADDEDEKKIKLRDDARLRKQKSREKQRQKGLYDEKYNKPMRQKRAEMKSKEPERYAAILAARRDKCPKRSDLSEEERQMECAKVRKRYSEMSPERKEKRNKQKRELEQEKVVALKDVLQLSKEHATAYFASIENCVTEAFKETEAFKQKSDEDLVATLMETSDDIKRACNKAKEPGDFKYLRITDKIEFTPLESTWKIHITNEDTELSSSLKQCCTNVFVKLHNPVKNPRVVATMITFPAILLKKQENSSRKSGYIKYNLTGLNVEYVDMLSTLPTKRARKKGYGVELMERSMKLLNADYVFLLTNEDTKGYYIEKLKFKEVGNDIKIKIPASWLSEQDIKSTFLYKKLKEDCQDFFDDDDYIILFDDELIIG